MLNINLWNLLDFFRSLMDISRNLISVEFSGISKLVKSGRFLRQKMDISGNLRLMDPGKFPRF